MKKMFLFLPAVLLALFISGCGDPIEKKVPESADQLFQLDGKSFVKTRTYQENQAQILKNLKEASLPESVLKSRIVIFASLKEKWGGVLIQTQNGDAAPLFEKITAECKENVKDLKIEEGGKKFSGRKDTTDFVGALLSKDLILIGFGKKDPAFFQAKSRNPLFAEIKKGMTLSGVGKISMPTEGKEKQYTDAACQMLPALQKLERYTINVPIADDPEVDFRMIFKDESAAAETLAAVNMGLGFVAQDNPELNAALIRKTEKNALLISFKINEMDKAVKAIQARKEQKDKALQAKQKAKKAKAKKQQPAKPAPAKPAAQPKTAAPAPVKAAPAEAPKAIAPAPAQPKAAAPAAKPAPAKAPEAAPAAK